MKSTDLASTSQKTGNQATAFDQIRSHEIAEQERTEKEISLFERERLSVARTKQDQEKKAEEEDREEARNTLKEFKESGMTQIIKEGENESAKLVQDLQKAYERHSPAVVKELVETALKTSFSIAE